MHVLVGKRVECQTKHQGTPRSAGSGASIHDIEMLIPYHLAGLVTGQFRILVVIGHGQGIGEGSPSGDRTIFADHQAPFCIEFSIHIPIAGGFEITG